MKFLNYLQEEFINIITSISANIGYPVYKNPSSSEISKLNHYIKKHDDQSSTVRGFIDITKKDIFLFPAISDVHVDAFTKLKKAKEITTPESGILNFLGYIVNSKVYGHNISTHNGECLMAKDIKFDWLSSFIQEIDTIKIDTYRAYAKFE